MKILSLMALLVVAANLNVGREVSSQDDSPAGLVVVEVKREKRREQPTDVRHTATDPDALQNTSMMPGGGGSNFPTFVYEYSAEIKNDSPKAVKWLSWMYVLTDPDGKQELDRKEFTSFDKIGVGQKKTVNASKRIAPMQPGHADPKKKKDGSPFQERVEFVCVGYDDGTLWHAPSISESHCRDAQKRGKSR
jgi:hypothetical protein